MPTENMSELSKQMSYFMELFNFLFVNCNF